MATVAEVRAERRSGLLMVAVIFAGLIALVAANFWLTKQGTSVAPEIRAPASPTTH